MCIQRKGLYLSYSWISGSNNNLNDFVDLFCLSLFLSETSSSSPSSSSKAEAVLIKAVSHIRVPFYAILSLYFSIFICEDQIQSQSKLKVHLRTVHSYIHSQSSSLSFFIFLSKVIMIHSYLKIMIEWRSLRSSGHEYRKKCKIHREDRKRVATRRELCCCCDQ